MLVALGFAAGLVIGVAMEEPRLLLGHLRGESESVRLVDAPYAEANAASAESTEVAAVENETSREVADSSEAVDDSDLVGRLRDLHNRQSERLALRDSEAVDSNVPSVAAPSRNDLPDGSLRASERVQNEAPATVARDSSRWAIQVGAFGDERVAIGLVDQLTAKRYPVDLIPSTDQQHRWRVRIQPIRGKARAQEIANRLKKEDGLPTWLIPLEADAG